MADTVSAPLAVNAPPTTPRPARKPRPNYGLIHRYPLPLEVHPLPAFLPHHPLSLLRLAYVLLSEYLTRDARSSHRPLIKKYHAYWDASTSSVHVTDPAAIRALWEQGFFGKGSLSRSEPEWMKLRDERRAVLKAQRDGRGGNTAAEVTRKRREERRKDKLERARLEAEALEEQLRAEGKLGSEKKILGEANKLEGTYAENGTGVQMNGHVDAETLHAKQDLEGGYVPAEVIADSVMPGAKMTTEAAIASIVSADEPFTSSTTGADTVLPPADAEQNQEHLQLTPSEAFFITYSLGVLDIHASSTSSTIVSTNQMLNLFRQYSYFPPRLASKPQSLEPDDPFMLNYITYHHYRSLGWVIRPGVKFGCDYLLYYRGPAFSHAEFAVLIIPDYSSWSEDAKHKGGKGKNRDWWWLHAANRVQSQVRKTLMLCYIEVPSPSTKTGEDSDIGALLGSYKIREFVLKRWSPNRDRG
jgi:tRNA-splicing endonuclease subunit Sen2